MIDIKVAILIVVLFMVLFFTIKMIKPKKKKNINESLIDDIIELQKDNFS